MDEKELKKLYQAVSSQLDIGDYDTFRGKMQTSEDRKRFYDAVGVEDFDLGKYDAYESRLAGSQRKIPTPQEVFSDEGPAPKRRIPTPQEVFGDEEPAQKRRIPTPEEVIGETQTNDSSTDPVLRLWKGLKEDGNYTKSLSEFKAKYSTPETINNLYNGLTQDGQYSKSKEEFYSQYFPHLTSKKKAGSPASPLGFEISRFDFQNPYASIKKNSIEVAGQQVDMGNTFGPIPPQEVDKKVKELREKVSQGKASKSEINNISLVTGMAPKAIETAIKDPETFKTILADTNKQAKVEYYATLDSGAKARLAQWGIDTKQLVENEHYAHAVQVNLNDSRKQELKALSDNHPFLNLRANAMVKPVRDEQAEYDKKAAEINKSYDLLFEMVGESAANDYARMNPTADPMEIGLEYEKRANPDRYKLRQKAGGSSPHDRDIMQKGIDALYATGDPHAITLAEQDEKNIDDRFPDKKNAEIYHKLGAIIYKQGKNNPIFNENPTPADLVVAARQLDEEDKQHFYKHILPLESRIIGSNVPVTGAVNKFGEAIATTGTEMSNTVRDIPIWNDWIKRTEKDQAKDQLKQPYETRFQNVGENPESVATLKYLNSKPELSDAEKAQKGELEKYTNVRSTLNEIMDGMGNVGGQVFIQAIGTRGLGNVLTRAAKGAGLLKTGRALQAIASEDAIANVATDIGVTRGTLDAIASTITSYASSYDAAKRASLELFPDDKDTGSRYAYANIVAVGNAASERIFKDEKILDAFGKSISPGVKSVVKSVAAGDLPKKALLPEIRNVFRNGFRLLGHGFVETNKEAIEEVAASGADSAAKLLLAPGKFNEKEAFDDALSTYTTMMLHGGPIGLLAGYSNFKASHAALPLLSQLGPNKSFTDDVKNEINRQVLSGEILDQEHTDKMGLVTEAVRINEKDMPMLEERGVPEKAKMKYLSILLHEKGLQQKMDAATDPVIKTSINKEIKAAQETRLGIYENKLTVDDNYIPVENKPELIQQDDINTEESPLLQIQAGLSSEATPEEIKSYHQRVKPVTSAIRNAAKKIREFEMKDSSGEKITGAFMDISGIPRHVVAKGLEIVADSIEAGASLADSIRSAVQHIAGLHPDKNPNEIREVVANHLEGVWGQNTTPHRGTKAGITQATQTGKITGDKISMTPRQALHKQIKDFIRGEKVGFKTGTETEKAKSVAMAGRIKESLNDAKNKGFIAPKQWESLFNRANKIGTSGKRFDKYADYLDKVLNDADYEAKLDTGKKLKDKITAGVNTKASEKSAYTQQSVKRFSKIDPSKVESIDDYNAIASKVVSVAEGLKASTRNGMAVTKNEAFEVDRKAIDDYVQAHEAYSNQRAKDRLSEDYSDLVTAGVIDPKTMSLKDMNELIDAINGEDQNAVQHAAELFEAREQKLQALRIAVDYNRIALENDPSYSKSENEIIAKLKQLDTSAMDAGSLASLNDIINNIVVNDDFTGSEKMAILADTQADIQKAQEDIEKSGIKSLGSIRNTLVQGFASMAQQHDFIFKSTKLASLIQKHAGISGVFDGHAKAKVLQDETVNATTKMKDDMGRNIDYPINRIRRGVLADVTNNYGGTTEEIAAEFNRRKNWIRQSAERMMQSDIPEEVKEGKITMEVYNELLENSFSAQDVERKSSKDNIRIVNFWRNQFDKRKDLTRQNAEQFNNKIWEDVEGYTATKLKNPGGNAGITPEEIKEVFTATYISNKVTQKIAGSKNRKVRSVNLPAGRVLDLDFDKVQSQVFYRTNYDVETSKAIEKVRTFFTDPRADKIFGGVGNKRIVMNSIREAVNAQRGQMPPLTPGDRIVNGLTNTIRAKGVRIALGSISQVIKQYPSVAINTVVNLGADAHLFGKAFMIPNNIKLFDQFAIALRGEAKAGFNKDVQLGEITKFELGSDIAVLKMTIKQKAEKLSDLIMAALVRSDVSVARTSWLAYYMQDLKKQGIKLDNINWQAEHENPNLEAAAYAEQQVSRTQNPNDVSSGSSFYRDSRGTSGFFKNLVLPFSTFVVNTRVRMTNDVQKILYGGNKAEAFKSLAGAAAEMTAFNAVKTYIIAYLTTMGARGVAGLFDMWDEEDEATAQNREQLTIETSQGNLNVSAKTKKMVANSVSDFFFSGLGSLTQSSANEGMNALYKLAATEYFADGSINKYPSLFYSRSVTDKTPDYAPYGLYGTLASKIASAKNSARYSFTGNYPGVTRGYEDVDIVLTEEERKLYTISFIVDALGIVGVSDADLLMLNQRLKWIADKKLADKYGVQDKLMERNVKPQ